MPKTVLPAHQARSRESLARLLKGAAEVLNKDGLEGATIPRIAARAGLSPGTVYRRFPDKDALLREVCLRLLEVNYRQSKELLTAKRCENMSLKELSRFVIALTLKGHHFHRGLLRALLLFTLQHPDAAFVRKSEELEWRTFHDVAELLLTRRGEIRHPDPDSAVRFALLMVGVMATGILILPRNPTDFSRFVPDVESRLARELPRMFLRYLGIEDPD
ncbi:MAG: helix-turn-helix domain-containing protein [Terriglobales bacterium]|jgi:AcrR family transcriptional regulator